jgi:hypothetical protein
VLHDWQQTMHEPMCRAQVRPDSPEFSGRLLSEINAANGPRQLLSLVQQFGPHLPAGQVAAVLSRLAGFVGGGGLEKEQVCVGG